MYHFIYNDTTYYPVSKIIDKYPSGETIYRKGSQALFRVWCRSEGKYRIVKTIEDYDELIISQLLSDLNFPHFITIHNKFQFDQIPVEWNRTDNPKYQDNYQKIILLHNLKPYICMVMDQAESNMFQYLNHKNDLTEPELTSFLFQTIISYYYAFNRYKLLHRDLTSRNLLLFTTELLSSTTHYAYQIESITLWLDLRYHPMIVQLADFGESMINIETDYHPSDLKTILQEFSRWSNKLPTNRLKILIDQLMNQNNIDLLFQMMVQNPLFDFLHQQPSTNSIVQNFSLI